MDKKYYIVKGKTLAAAIEWITGQKPYVFDDKNDNTKCIYSFVYDSDFKEAMDTLNQLRRKLNKNI